MSARNRSSVMQNRHHAEVGEQIVERLALDNREGRVFLHQRVIATGQLAALDLASGKAPGIALVAGHPDLQNKPPS